MDKHSIGIRIENSLFEILDYLVLASKKTGNQRMLLLEKIDRENIKIQIMIRVSNKIKAMKDSHYIEIEKMLLEIGKMIGGWIKSENKNKSENLSDL